MKAGISIWLDRPLSDCAEQAVAAEAAGFSEAWLPDHYFLRDCYAAQALIAERTSRLFMGTAVVSPLLRHPVLLASSVATINELSGGRAIMGLGVGGFEFPTQLGLKVRSPLTVAREGVHVIRSVLQGGVDFRGEAFTATGARLGWDTRPIPVYMAARGPKMLELAGEIADGVITHGLAPSYIEFCQERIRVGAKRAGRSPEACKLILMFELELDEHQEVAIERLRPRCTIMAGGEYSEDLIGVLGLDRDDIMSLRAAVRRGDPTAGSQVTDQMVHAFALGGPRGYVTERLTEMAEAGAAGIIVMFGGVGAMDQLTRIERAGKVIAGMVG